MKLHEEISVAAELTGTTMSEAAAVAMAEELAQYERIMVSVALRKCRRELKGRLTLAAVIERLDDGRPGAEEAWAMMPLDERQSVVWTEEMAQAFAVCGPLIDAGDKIAARMAFKATYSRMVAEARDSGRRVKWTPSLGHDPMGREAALQAAVEHGRLTYKHAQDIVPTIPPPSKQIAIVASELAKRITET